MLLCHRLLFAMSHPSLSQIRNLQTVHQQAPTVFLPNQKQFTQTHNKDRVRVNLLDHTTQINLSSLEIHHFPDDRHFNLIPQLQHGLSKFLTGQLYIGDYGVGEIPQSLHQDQLKMMTDYRPPKQDPVLFNKSKQQKCQYFSSTSSISTPLIHLYFLYSHFRCPLYTNITLKPEKEKDKDKEDVSKLPMASFRKPITFILNKHPDNMFSIDSDKGFFKKQMNQVLLQFGMVAQTFLTTSKANMERMLADPQNAKKPKSYYRYARINKTIMLRSQIDCKDTDNGDQIVFEIKTRASCPIRYDVFNYLDYLDYPIEKKHGQFKSFQREYYDLIRGGFIKYAMQLKIGKMDGAFIAYHNTKNIYGYEYVKMKEIVLRLFGDQYNFDMAFSVCSRMLTEILDYIRNDTQSYNYEHLKIGLYADALTKVLIVIVEVVQDPQMCPIIDSVPINMSQYFAKYVPVLKNPVFKYQFDFYILINDIIIRSPQIYFAQYDRLGVNYAVKKYGRIMRDEYIEFLQEAYKNFFTQYEDRYCGRWEKQHLGKDKR